MPEGAITIRKAEVGDAELCAEFEPGVRNVINAHREIVLNAIRSGFILLAHARGVPVGYLRYSVIYMRVPYIEYVTVREEHRKSGIASRLLEALAHEPLVLAAGFIMSSSQLDTLPAQEWHRRRGFNEIGILTRLNAGEVGEVFFRLDLLNQQHTDQSSGPAVM